MNELNRDLNNLQKYDDLQLHDMQNALYAESLKRILTTAGVEIPVDDEGYADPHAAMDALCQTCQETYSQLANDLLFCGYTAEENIDWLKAGCPNEDDDTPNLRLTGGDG